MGWVDEWWVVSVTVTGYEREGERIQQDIYASVMECG